MQIKTSELKKNESTIGESRQPYAGVCLGPNVFFQKERWMCQLVAGPPVSGSFVDYLTLYEYFTIRVGVYFNLNLKKILKKK